MDGLFGKIRKINYYEYEIKKDWGFYEKRRKVYFCFKIGLDIIEF